MTTTTSNNAPPAGWVRATEYAAEHGIPVQRLSRRVNEGLIVGGPYLDQHLGLQRIYVDPTTDSGYDSRAEIIREEYDFFRSFGMDDESAIRRLSDAYNRTPKNIFRTIHGSNERRSPKTIVECLRCKRARPYESRGLCGSCYNIVRGNGTVDDWPVGAPIIPVDVT